MALATLLAALVLAALLSAAVLATLAAGILLLLAGFLLTALLLLAGLLLAAALLRTALVLIHVGHEKLLLSRDNPAMKQPVAKAMVPVPRAMRGQRRTLKILMSDQNERDRRGYR